jgi:mycothiol synthase
MTDLINETTRAEIGIPWTTLEETRAGLTEPDRDPERDVLLVDGAGAARGYLHTRSDDESASGVFNLIYVHPEWWGRGLGSYLVRLGEERVQTLLDRAPGGDRCRVQVARFTTVDAAARLFEALGYHIVRTFWEMHVELDREPPAYKDPDGITIRAVDPERDIRPVHDALADAFADHWGRVLPSFERWRHRAIEAEGADFDPGLWFVAVDGDQIVGAVTCRAEAGRDDASAEVDYVGVRGAWRRRGIALALLRAALRELHTRGIPRAHLGVDAENASGATELYERAGMRAAYSWDFWEKELRKIGDGR